MHLDPVDGPFVSHNLISAQKSSGRVPLLKFQMAPRLKVLVSSGSKKGTQICFFSQKVPVNDPPPFQVPQQGPYGERYPFTGHFYISLKSLINIPLNKKFFPLLSKAQRKERPSMFPQSGDYMETDAHFRSLT